MENESQSSVDDVCVYKQEDLNESLGLEIFEKLKNQGKLEKTLQEGVLFFTEDDQSGIQNLEYDHASNSVISLEEVIQERTDYMEEVDEYLQKFMGFLDDDFKPSTLDQDVVPATPHREMSMDKTHIGGFK